ncbi:MAG: flippase [Flavobacteriaceae bacterium]
MSLIRKNFIYNNLLGFTNVIVPIIIFPYISRVFGPEGLGIVSFAISLTASFIMIASLGIPIYGIREIAKVKNDPEQLSKTYSEILLIQLVWLIVSLFIYGGWIFFSKTFTDEPIIQWVSFVHIVGMIGLLHWFYQGIENYKFITTINVLIKLLTIGLLYSLVTKQEEYWLYYMIVVGATLLGSIISILYSFRYVSFQYRSLSFRRHFKSIGILFGTQLAIGIYINLDVVFLKYLSNDEQVGFYAPAKKLAKVCLLVITSLGTVLIPRLSEYIKQGELKKTQELISKSIRFVLILSLPIMVLLIMLAPEIISIFAGPAFNDSILLLQYLVPLIILIGMSNIFGLQILVPFHKENQLMIAVLIGAVISLVLNILLIPSLESLGAVYAILATEFVITILTFIVARKIISIKVSLKALLSYSILALLIIPVCWSMDIYFEGWVFLGVASILSFIIYTGGLFLLRDSFFINTIWNPIFKSKK